MTQPKPSVPDWLDELCDRFETAWHSEKRFSIEFVLQEVSQEKHSVVLQALLELEVELRSKAGDALSMTELQRRFPEHPKIVQTVFENPLPTDSMMAGEPIASGQLSITDSLSIPSQLGRYRIVRKLGRGAMATVFLAVDEQLDRKVALKIPHGDMQRNEELRTRFEREARASAALSHPNICPIYDVSEFDGIHYISMGYVEGLPLSRYAVSESGLTEQHIAKIVLKLARALTVAHDADVIHRDLKPANVIVDEDHEPVILDFGLALRLNQSTDVRVTQEGAIVGSPAYMSPEQVKCQYDSVGALTDIYALGVVMYELLTGELPFNGTAMAVLGQILTEEPEKPSNTRRTLNVRLEKICLKMMSKIPADRHPTMKAVAEELEEYLQKFDVDSTAAEPVEPQSLSEPEQRKLLIQRLIKSADYAQAEKLMVALSRETDQKFHQAAAWAAAELPKLRETREKVRAGRKVVFATATRLMKANDYEQAAQLLREYPYDLRTPRMQELLEAAELRASKVKQLRTKIMTFVGRSDDRKLKPLLQKLLTLKPADRRAKEMLSKIDNRSHGPITKVLGDRSPAFVHSMAAIAQWGLLASLVAVAVVPAYLWSNGYLTAPGKSSSEADSIRESEPKPGVQPADAPEAVAVDETDVAPNSSRPETRAAAEPVWTDLLEVVSDRDSGAGWNKNNNSELEFTGKGLESVALPFDLPPNYEAEFVVLAHDRLRQLAITLPIHSGFCVFVLRHDPVDPSDTGGLELIDSVDFKANPKKVTRQLLTIDNLKLTTTVQSSAEETTIDVNSGGESVFRWQGATSRLSLNNHWNHGEPNRLGLGGIQRVRGKLACVIKSIRVRSISAASTAAALPAPDAVHGKTVVLFDGRRESLRNFVGYRQDEVPKGWVIDGDALMLKGKGGQQGAGLDLITVQKYEDFELMFDWKISPGGNSGVLYRVHQSDSAPQASGIEYQVLDDQHPDYAKPKTWKAASLFGLQHAINARPMPAGEWNSGKVIVNDDRVEHWLNGTRVVQATIGSQNWESRLRKSSFRSEHEFAKHRLGHICLQDYGHPVWFRNIRIRSLD